MPRRSRTTPRMTLRALARAWWSRWRESRGGETHPLCQRRGRHASGRGHVPDARAALRSPARSSQAQDLAAEFRRVSRLANANGVTIHSLETAGLRGFSAASAEENPLPIDPLARISLDSEKAADTQQLLFNLASETGGRAALNGNDLRPDLAADRRRSAELLLAGLYARALRRRPGACDRGQGEAGRAAGPSPHDVHRPPAGGAAGGAGADGAPARDRRQPPAGGARSRLLTAGRTRAAPGTLRLRLPVKQLVLLSQGGAWTGQLTLWIGARDAAGRSAPVQSVRVPVRIPAARGQEQLGRTFAVRSPDADGGARRADGRGGDPGRTGAHHVVHHRVLPGRIGRV